MNDSDNIIEVNETDFETQVLTYSFKIPVVVDFWAEWCGPCRILGPILEHLAEEAQGSFRLAKLNVDENQNLAIRYGVSSIPYVKAFRDGKVTSEFIGAQPEPRVREFIHALAPSPMDLSINKGKSLLDNKEWQGAEKTFKQILGDSPVNASAMLGLAKSLLMQDKAGEALEILENFPASKEYASAQTLLPLVKTLVDFQNGEALDEDPLDAAYHQALRLIRRNNLPAAIDGLLDILRQNKHYRNNETRQVLVGLLDLLGENNPQTRQYRQELASVLF
jgi:putative thioredoxin